MSLPEEIEAALAAGGEPAERIETHISWVFRTASRVLKVKKPVRLGFLDFGTEAARRAACVEELRVNERFAPGVYRGLARIVRTRAGAIVLDEPTAGDVVEHGVWMDRLPDEERADLRLARGALARADVERIAETIARHHGASAAADLAMGSAELIAAHVRENFEALRASPHLAGAEAVLSPSEAREVEAWQLEFLRTEGARFEARRSAGAIRDGHGDLRLEHVYVGDAGIRILDAIEFDPAFRAGDVAADVAFLSMDLASMGHVELAERFLARYARETNDFDLFGVVDFYEAYRACVRAKIALLRDDRTTARRMLLLALACGRRTVLRPAVVAVGGLIASGKSTLADALGAAMSAPVVDADRTRKSMLAVAATTPVHHAAWGGAYALEFTEQVYAEMLRRAAVVLASGRPVVVEASFRSREMRERVRALARDHRVPFHLVECVTPVEVCRARLAERARSASISDGRADIFDDFVKKWEPITELGGDVHLAIDGTIPVRTTVAALAGRLPLWPAGLDG
jgi:aminoglycoside phosphotransferase family enzyme/predicted kinase